MTTGRVLFFVCAMLGAHQALAQSQQEFVAAFSGDWQIVDPSFVASSASDNQICRVTLDATPKDKGYVIKSEGCKGRVADLSSWSIVGNQLELVDGKAELVARLGGNLSRLSGATAWSSTLILERVDAVKRMEAIRERVKCVYFGYTSDCATEEQMNIPLFAGSRDGETSAFVLTRLNVRAEPRLDSQVVTELKAKTCVSVVSCATASDGNWCRVSNSESSGWIQQTSVRLNRFLVLTYTPGCLIENSN